MRYAAYVFDAYGTLFDVNSAARLARDALGAQWEPLAELWRAKQLQYTWLRSLMGRHADFWQVTGDALDYTLAARGIHDEALRTRLMRLYLELDAYAEVRSVLETLAAAGRRRAILSNGSPRMLAAAVDHAGIADLLDAVLSIEEVGTYKPHFSVYRLVTERFGAAPAEVCFVSSNAWDAWGAKAYGFYVVWCNRFNQPPERLGEPPDAEVRSLAELPALLGAD